MGEDVNLGDTHFLDLDDETHVAAAAGRVTGGGASVAGRAIGGGLGACLAVVRVDVDAGGPAAAALDVANEVALGRWRPVVAHAAHQALGALAERMVAALFIFDGDFGAGACCSDHALHCGPRPAASGFLRGGEVSLGRPLARSARLFLARFFCLKLVIMECFAGEAVANF